MAHGTVTLADVSALFKEVYPEKIQNQINLSSVLLANLTRTNRNIEIGTPSVARVPFRVGRNPAVGARAFMTPAPDAGHSRNRSGTIALAYNYGVGIIPGQFFRAKGTEAAFASYLQSEIDGLTESAKSDENRQLLGDGRGILSTITDPVAPTNTLTVSDTRGHFIGQRVDIVEITTGVAAATARHVTAIDPVAITVTFDGAALDPGANHAFYTEGARHQEIIGLRAAISDANPLLGPYLGIDVAEPTWRATVTDATAFPPGDPTEDLFQRTLDAVDVASGRGGTPKLMIGTHATRRNFANTLLSDRRIVSDTMTLKGGFKAVSWNNNAFVTDKDQGTGRLDFLDLEMARLYEMSDWDFMDEDGNRLFRDPDGRDAYTFTLFSYKQFATMMRNANATIHTITGG